MFISSIECATKNYLSELSGKNADELLDLRAVTTIELEKMELLADAVPGGNAEKHLVPLAQAKLAVIDQLLSPTFLVPGGRIELPTAGL